MDEPGRLQANKVQPPTRKPQWDDVRAKQTDRSNSGGLLCDSSTCIQECDDIQGVASSLLAGLVLTWLLVLADKLSLHVQYKVGLKYEILLLV